MTINENDDPLIRPAPTSILKNVKAHQANWEDWDLVMCEPCRDVNPLEESGADEEGENPKVLRDPGLPSKKARDEHDVTHIPYRSWCAHCVRGSGRYAQSRTI